MRLETSKEKLHQLMKAIGLGARGPGEDLRQMLLLKLVERKKLRELFDQIEPLLNRFPAIDPEEFRRKLEEALGEG